MDTTLNSALDGAPPGDDPPQEDFIDFEVEIGQGAGRVYPVAVVRSAAGEAHESMQFPFDTLALENRLLTLQNALLLSGGKRRHVLLPEEQSVKDFGCALFNALFTGQVGTLYAVSRDKAALQGKGLRLKLRILSPDMAILPWEFLYDPSRAEYICLSRTTPVVRYLELPQPPEPLPVTLPLRILGMVAAPTNLPPLDVEREQQRIQKALEPLQQRGLVELHWLSGQTWQAVQRAMRDGPWHIFHFIGHGSFDTLTEEGTIAFADEHGQADMLSATQLGRLLADHRSLRLVVLNACEGAKGGQHDIYSSTAATLVRYGIPAVLAMQYAVTDTAAIAFSRAFYEAVCDGMPIDAAVSEARKAVTLELDNTLEWGVPVLFMRSSNGVLFYIGQGVGPSIMGVSGQSSSPALPRPSLTHLLQIARRSTLHKAPRYPQLLWISLVSLVIIAGIVILIVRPSPPFPSNPVVTVTSTAVHPILKRGQSTITYLCGDPVGFDLETGTVIANKVGGNPDLKWGDSCLSPGGLYVIRAVSSANVRIANIPPHGDPKAQFETITYEQLTGLEYSSASEPSGPIFGVWTHGRHYAKVWVEQVAVASDYSSANYKFSYVTYV